MREWVGGAEHGLSGVGAHGHRELSEQHRSVAQALVRRLRLFGRDAAQKPARRHPNAAGAADTAAAATGRIRRLPTTTGRLSLDVTGGVQLRFFVGGGNGKAVSCDRMGCLRRTPAEAKGACGGGDGSGGGEAVVDTEG